MSPEASVPDPVCLSVLVPVKDEEANLARCLRSVAWADQRVVVDSGSTDRTVEIAGAHGAEVVQFTFNGTWPKKKNWALESVSWRHPWVLILDADEVMPPEAEEEIRAIVSNPDESRAGFWINRRFMFMGKWLRHAYYPNWNLRLFRHKLGRYEKLTDQPTESGDNEVHEHVLVEGETGKLKAEMDHHAFPSVGVFVEKHNRYSNWEARVALDHHLRRSAEQLQDRSVGGLRRIKVWVRRLPGRPLLRFLWVYLFQGGWMDGREGYYFARLHGFYEFLSVAKTYELRKQAKRPTNEKRRTQDRVSSSSPSS